MFIKRSDRIAITADGVIDEASITPEMDVIWIYRKMNFGMRAEFAEQFNKSTRTNTHASLLMLDQSIAAWQGPSFGDVPVTPATIRELDLDEPIVIKALEETTARNSPKPDPNSTTSNDAG